jgi:hypothetical protein
MLCPHEAWQINNSFPATLKRKRHVLVQPSHLAYHFAPSLFTRGNVGSKAASAPSKGAKNALTNPKNTLGGIITPDDHKDNAQQIADRVSGKRITAGPGPIQKAVAAQNAASAFQQAGQRQAAAKKEKISAFQPTTDLKKSKRDLIDDLFARDNPESQWL